MAGSQIALQTRGDETAAANCPDCKSGLAGKTYDEMPEILLQESV